MVNLSKTAGILKVVSFTAQDLGLEISSLANTTKTLSYVSTGRYPKPAIAE